MFKADRFIQDCCDGLREVNAHAALREIVARAVSEPRQVLKSLGEPKVSGIETLYRSGTLTILNVLWGPGMTLYPHDHRMWAVIGIYSGREDNIFWRRSGSGSKWPIEVVGAASLCAGSHRSFDFDVIHSVTNPLDKVTAGIHVYGGDLSLPPRSAWDGDTLTEAPLSHARDIRAIEAYNATLTD